MTFFDEDPKSLPEDAQYYFNVLVKIIAIHPDLAEHVFGADDIQEMCFIDEITSPRPSVIYCFVDDDLDEDTEFEIECYPHCVVEISQSLGVSWWRMLDFDPDDPWRIDPYEA